MPLSKKYKVDFFVVYDDPLLWKILEKKFKSNFPYEVKAFDSGETFLRHLAQLHRRKNRLRIVILDHNRSGSISSRKDTFEVVKYIKDINPKVKVIILSSYLDDGIRERANLLGVNACIKKNENSFLRIENTLHEIISTYYIKSQKRQYRSTFIIFGIVLTLFILIHLINANLF